MRNFGILLLTFFLPLSVLAKKVYVLPAGGKGVDEGTLASVTELTKEAVQQRSGYSVTDSKSNYDVKLKLSVHKLGSSYILSGVKKNKAGDGLFRSKLKAKTLEDMDMVIERVVRALLTEETAKRNANVDDVTEDEVDRGTRRYKALKQWYFGIGPAWGKEMNTPKASMAYTLGYSWMVDPQYDLSFGFDWFIPEGNNDAQFSQLSMGLGYFFSKKKNAPFALAQFGYAWVASSDPNNNDPLSLLSDDKANGFTLSVGLGYKFFRTSTTNFGVVARHSVSFTETSGSGSKPQLTTLALVLYRD